MLVFCVFSDRDGVEAQHKHANKNKKRKKKRTKPYSSHLDRISSVNKGFIIWDKEHQKNNLREIFVVQHSA